MHPHSQKILFIVLEVIVCIASVVILFNLHSPSHVLNTSSETQSSAIQGQVVSEPYVLWVKPQKGQVVHNAIRLEASISLPISDDFKIDHIIFTAWWTGVDPRNWRNICAVSRPAHQHIFQCDGNLRQLQAPLGRLMLSFDMYDIHHHVRLAPDGGFPVTYSSSSST